MRSPSPSIGNRQRLRYFDTFTGMGGFTVALSELGHECIGFSEIDRYASSVYSYHFPSHPNHGDITRIDAASLTDFDILVGGFPCQAFSVAGKRRGFADTRGTLFFDLARILQAKRPRYFVFENVKGLLSHDGGSTFKTIIAALDELGYDVQWQVLNSKHFGVPQNRERVFIVGHTRGSARPEVFPFGEGEGGPDEEHGQVGSVARTLTCKYGERRRGSHVVEVTEGVHQSVRVYSPDGKSPTLFGNDYGGGKTPKIIQRHRGNNPGGVRDDGLAPTVQKGFGDGNVAVVDVGYQNRPPRVYSESSPTLRANSRGGGHHIPLAVYPGHAVNEADGIANTLKAGTHGVPGGEGLVRIDSEIRRLTPVECERLQGFPDNWTSVGVNGPISDTQRYKMCGNAVTVNVVREIVRRLP